MEISDGKKRIIESGEKTKEKEDNGFKTNSDNNRILRKLDINRNIEIVENKNNVEKVEESCSKYSKGKIMNP